LANIFGTWNPCATVPELCIPQDTKLAVSNFKGVKGTSSSQLTWNATWPVSGITYTLYKSTDNVTYTSIYSVTEPTDSMVNFSYNDPALPASGAAWSYYVSASKSGYATEISDTVTISNKATLDVNASAALNYCGFSQLLGTPSATQTFTLAGSNLTSNVIVTPPAPYEVSTDNVAWYTNASPLSQSPVAGAIATTTIYIRLNASAIGNYAGNVTVSSTGATTTQFPITGVTFAASTSFPLQQWPLTQNNIDSVGTRSPAIIASTSTLNRLYTSDGTQPTAGPIPAYSGQYGQALGANTSGNNWSNIGATLNRNYYEQFTVTAAAGAQIRVDSITFLSDFYNTISGIKMGVVYSKNGFSSPADSSEFYSGVGPGGVSLTTAISGSFTKSFTLQRNDAGPVNRYSISLNGINGVTLNSGETITIRLYWACGSTGTPRFAYLKDVIAKGVVLNPVATTLVNFDAKAEMVKNHLTWTLAHQEALKHIEVQKSVDGIRFETMTIQPLQINVTGNYSWDDAMPKPLQYYRLKITDMDGSYFYSPISLIQRKAESIHYYPNPVGEHMTIAHNTALKGATISIYDVAGKLIHFVSIDQGSSSTALKLKGIADGLYIANYFDGITHQTFKFIKKR